MSNGKTRKVNAQEVKDSQYALLLERFTNLQKKLTANDWEILYVACIQ